MDVVLTVTRFRELFPEFSDELFGDAVIQGAISQGTVFMSSCMSPQTAKTEMLAALLTAHLLVVDNPDAFAASTTGASGASQNGNVISVKVGNVHMGFAAPPNKTVAQYYWMKTKYGQQMLALSKVMLPSPILLSGTERRVYRGNLANRRL